MKTQNQYNFTLFLSAIIVSGLVYFALCSAAEFKKLKKNDLRLDGNICYLPRSPAFGFGFGALICIFIAQFIGNLFICKSLLSIQQNMGCKVRKPSISCILLLFSWINFGLAVMLISVATSMNRSQTVGQGWLDEECYLVKDGVYVGSGFLGLMALGLTLGYGAVLLRRIQAEDIEVRSPIMRTCSKN